MSKRAQIDVRLSRAYQLQATSGGRAGGGEERREGRAGAAWTRCLQQLLLGSASERSRWRGGRCRV